MTDSGAGTTSATPYVANVYFEGWDYRVPVPDDVRAQHNLDHVDPWLRLLCILERAKEGDLTHGPRLAALCNAEDTDLRFAAQYLLAHVGTTDDLRVLQGDISTAGGDWRMETADHAALSGSLTFVDTFIAGYRIAFGETTRGAMEDGLSNLLTTDPDSRFVADCLHAQDREAGEDRLRERARQQAINFGPGVALYRGSPLTIAAVTEDIDETLTGEPWESFAHLQSLVTRLQTMIGFSQSGLFTEADDGLAHKWDEPRIREIIDHARSLTFESGLRHFWGHPAPLQPPA